MLQQLLNLVNAVFAVLAVLGIVLDPTTEGLSDSDRAMSYEKAIRLARNA